MTPLVWLHLLQVDPLRRFYSSLHEQIPESDMAKKWCASDEPACVFQLTGMLKAEHGTYGAVLEPGVECDPVLQSGYRALRISYSP